MKQLSNLNVAGLAKRTPSDAKFGAKPKMSRKRKWAVGCSIAVVVIIAGMVGGTWFSSNLLLHPSFGGLGNFSVCTPEAEKDFGKNCGNLRQSHEFAFSEVSVPSLNGYNMPGWLVKAADNGYSPAKGVIMLVHAGGSDRREDTRHIATYLSLGLDVLTFDQGCAGKAPCPVGGLSYGARESQDVVSAYLYLNQKYGRVYAMGSSVGAAAILVALPEMPKLSGAIIENAFTSFDRLVRDSPDSKNVPAWATDNMINLTKARGQFDGFLSPEHSLPLAGATIPLFFIHSKVDVVVSYTETEDLTKLYRGPETAWYPDVGQHALISNAQPALYSQKITSFMSSIK
ncbi:MAG TPA: hypothetical protein VLG36_04120 [Candidatus Chromulinivoraceae bacterium]|nr:hypothetical protein [Candidatus Chromulinivoraceae bacterium]